MSYEFADRLIELRRSQDLSQEELAKKLGLSRQAISKWERAESAPDIGNLVALSELYEISLDDLVRGIAPEVESETEAKTKAEAEAETATENSPETKQPEKSVEDAPALNETSTPTEANAAISENEAAAEEIASPKTTIEDFQESAPSLQPNAYQQAYGAAPQAASGSSMNTNTQSVPASEIPVAPNSSAETIAPNTADVDAQKTSRAWRIFPYPLLCIVIYLFLGFFCGLWHPGWIVFLTIPFYYWVVSLILHDPNYKATHQTTQDKR
ncbi:helix-turn-helix domain-containing protein [Adlercreutzia sp. ZJ154]|uniref:helix-turn-helix domain-containing protein n=1 Tax=Adlercreutzia sp. ZJ154 TaxID=2709790 RepID=UPI00197ED910|nr:helix-turn-helix transcriptional regulator [Adlercreutzia sp. ZJ154]